MRIEDGIRRDDPVSFTIDGARVSGWAGETIAAVLMAQGTVRMRDDRSARPRGLFCNMGACGECTVTARFADGRTRRVRACLVAVENGLSVSTARARLDV